MNNAMLWLLDAANWFGSAVCHQWDSHSYFIAGVPLCLCARCTGMYLGGLLTLLYLALRKPRAAQLPKLPYLVALLVFFFLWAGDGVNSFASVALGHPFLYEPQNSLRLITGALMGISLGSLLFVMLNGNLYRNPYSKPIYENAADFLILLALIAALVLLVNSQMAWLLYPLSALMLVAVIGLNASIWTALAASFFRAVTQPREALSRFAVGITLALLLLNGLALGRYALGVYLGVPL
ncbi:MAG: hypothetical protein HDKAJFGB_02366 [Anaerolineae bacterium]|nr:hypothetical protein [Anaerolineae bacterium]RIK28730.1 MAG: hypothetical protein DCC52_08045 [Chloroflexota bacterium]